MRLTLWLILAVVLAAPVFGQTLDVTFRLLSDNPAVEAAFVPGSFNGWGQPYTADTNSCIMDGHASQMSFVRFEGYWRYTVPLDVGATYLYKIQTHFNEAGTDCAWSPDLLNPNRAGQNDDSEVTITDPMIFQLGEELAPSGLVKAVSAGLFSSTAITTIAFTVNGVERRDGTSFYDPATGVFRFVLDREVRAGSQFIIVANTVAGEEVRMEIGELLPPIEWVSEPFSTVKAQYTVRATLTRLDGSIDPDLTEATVLVNGVAQTASVTDGLLEAAIDLPETGDYELVIDATIEGQDFTSDALTLSRRLHPLDAALVVPEVSGEGLDFSIILNPIGAGIPPGFVPQWTFDEDASTTDIDGGLIFALNQLSVSGTATGPGELYFDIEINDGDLADQLSVGVIIEADGTVREMAYAETAAWIDNAVVYEIFPLSFGPEASGTSSSPGNRFNEITAELDYLAEMGFNAIWFMPIYNDQFMNQVSAGYNIVDFFTVDPKLGTNDDFKALVERAHELGIKIVLDLTPSHVSPVHPWTNSLRAGGVFSDFIQTTPSTHSRGLDGRGANLPEIWQVENGEELYRKYDGFGDLANLNWDDDDLQAAMLEMMAFWVNEFDIDGWRLDVYWGPWRRYGPDRFGRPIRELMKRLKPDMWLLGEIAGTGSSTEVYYADDERGSPISGGIDAGYDWNFYFNGIKGAYGNIPTYDALAHNGDFYAGPHARYFRFLENHDEVRIAKTHENNLDRVLALTGFLLTTTGVPMVYQGQEVGFGAGLPEFTGRRAGVSWQTDRNGEFARYYQRLAQARAQFEAFGTQEMKTIHETSSVYGYVRPLLDANAVVAVNFASTPRTVTLDPSPWVEMTTDGPVPYYDIFADTSGAHLGAFTVTIAPYETVVYITDTNPGFVLPDLPALPFGATYTGNEGEGGVPETFRLDAAYPNPFNPTTTLRFALPQSGPVRLDVFDVLGRRVATLVDGVRTAGTHTVAFDAAGLPSGTYLYRLAANGRVHTRTMVLVK